MRSLFGASAIMLMVFSYIEISSGMSSRDRRKDKDVMSYDQQLSLLEREFQTKSNLKSEEDDNDQHQSYNAETGQFTGDVYHGQQAVETKPVERRRGSRFSEQIDINGNKRKFDHKHIRFDGDDPYIRGSAERKHALAIQWWYIQHSKKAVPENPETTGDPKTNPSAPALSALERYQKYKRTDGLRPEVLLSGRHEADMQYQLRHNPLISTPSRKGMPRADFNTNSFNPQQHVPYNQPTYHQQAGTLYPGQPYGAGYDPRFINQGPNYWQPQQQPYPNAPNLGQGPYFDPNSGLPPNPQFSQSSGAPHQYYQGPSGNYGPGYQN